MKRLMVIIFLLAIALVGCGQKKEYQDDFNKLLELCEILNKYHYSNPDMETLLDGALDGAIASLNDQFTYGVGDYFGISDSSMDSDGTTFGYGFSVNIPYAGGLAVVKKVIFNSPAYLCGLRTSDNIVEVNGRLLDKLQFSEILAIFEEDHNSMDLVVMRQGVLLDLHLEKGNYIKEKEVSSRMLNENTGYLKISSFSTENMTNNLINDELFFLEKNQMETLIIDLRGNGGGSITNLYYSLCIFVKNKDNLPMMYLDGYNYEGDKLEYKIKNYVSTNDKAKDYDIKILVDSDTASAAEAFAAVMQNYMGYYVYGETTYGKGIYQNYLEVSDNYSLYISLGKWYYRDKNGEYQCLQSKGLVPDYLVGQSDLYGIDSPALVSDLRIDTVNVTEVSKIGKYLTALGYETRWDGYFDKVMADNLALVFALNGYENYEYGTIDAMYSDILYFMYKEKEISYDCVLKRAEDDCNKG